MRTKPNSNREHYQSISFDRIILEITNFEGLEAESEAAWKKLLNRVDYGNKKYTQNEENNKETKLISNNDKKPCKSQKNLIIDNKESHHCTNYKKLLANDNVIIIDKTPSKLRPTTQQIKEQEENNSKSIKAISKNFISKTEMPQPNTVRYFKDVFESLNFPPMQKHNHVVPKTSRSLGRSMSLPKNNKKQSLNIKSTEKMKNFSKQNSFTHKNDKSRKRNSFPTKIDIPENLTEFQTEEEEKREWRNACSPVSPEVIQQIRKHGISMTFFGRPAYSASSSPIMNGSITSYGEEWPKSRILDITKKYSDKTISSLCSSSTCSEEDFQYNVWENNDKQCRDIFGDGYYYYSILNLNDDNEDECINRDDSYDIIYLNETYSRSSTPKLGTMNKGIWLKDPYWHGSSYIIYDFRGTDVKPNIAVK